MKINIYKGKDNEWRSILGVSSSNPLVFIGVNPSIATNNFKDSTTKKIESYCQNYGYDGYYIINLYPQVQSNPILLHERPNQNYININYNEIDILFSKCKKAKVIACWGESIGFREYLFDSLNEIKIIAEKANATWFSIGELLKSGHPRHPARSSLKLEMAEFDINSYVINVPRIKKICSLEIKDFTPYYEIDYQNELTAKLDEGIIKLNQDVLNEIVLWKVNRYATIANRLFKKLNNIEDIVERNDLIKVISELIGQKGIGLPMASTILRFMNPKRFQIIDQRAFRVVYGRRLVIPSSKVDQAVLYLNYLEKIEQFCYKNSLPFEIADRILYNLDRDINRKIQLSNY